MYFCGRIFAKKPSELVTLFYEAEPDCTFFSLCHNFFIALHFSKRMDFAPIFWKP